MKMDDIVTFCKNYGFIYQGSEIYGGLAILDHLEFCLKIM